MFEIVNQNINYLKNSLDIYIGKLGKLGIKVIRKKTFIRVPWYLYLGHIQPHRASRKLYRRERRPTP